MGHDLPAGAWGRLQDLIIDHLTRFTAPSKEIR
jgi:hypothetical protein